MGFSKGQLVMFGIVGVLVVIVVLVVFDIIPGLKPSQPSPFRLVVWGNTGPPEVWKAIEEEYQKTGVRTATIEYVKKSPQTYESELLDALASGNGPDIFTLPDVWIAKHFAKILPLADGELGYRKRDLKNIFADSLTEAIVDNTGSLLGTPLAFDTLALFFNRDYLNAANIPNPPATWDEFVDTAKKLTSFSEVGGIQRSGIALGTGLNVEHAADIFLALLSQSGGNAIDPVAGKSALDKLPAPTVLRFYTSFADSTKKTYSWNNFFENSIAAFAKGDAAMAFGYASDIPKIVLTNPQLNFDVAPFPQGTGQSGQANFGRFSILAVSRLAKNSEHAWNFLLWLQGKKIQKAYIDAVGLPPARRDLATSKPPRDYLLSFYDEVLSAKTLPIAGDDLLPKALIDMIEDVINHRFTLDEAIQRASNKINSFLPER